MDLKTLTFLGNDKEGKAVYLEDLWPSSKEIEDTINNSLTSEMFIDEYESVFQGPEEWVKLSSSKGNKLLSLSKLFITKLHIILFITYCFTGWSSFKSLIA